MLAVEGSNVGIWTWDAGTHQLTLSPQWKRLLGYADADLQPSVDVMQSLVHPDDWDPVLGGIRACLRGETSIWESEHRLRHRDGRHRWVLARGFCYRDAGGHPLRLAGTTVDITQLKLAQAEALLRLRHAAMAADVAVALGERERLDDVLQAAADAMVRHLDVAVARVWTMSPWEPVLELQATAGPLAGDDDRVRRVPLGEPVGRIAASREAVVTNDLRQDPSRPEGCVSFAGFPLVVGDRVLGVMALFATRALSSGTIEALESVARTLAIGIERTRLREARRRFEDLLEAAPDFVTIGEVAGPPIYINRAARAALGIGAGEPVPSLLAFRPPEFVGRFEREILPATIRDGVWRGETEYVARDGRVIPVSQVSVTHAGSPGAPVYLSTISRDITQEKRTEAALRAAEARLRFALAAADAQAWELDLTSGRITTAGSLGFHQLGVAGDGPTTTEEFVASVHPDDRDAMQQAVTAASRRPPPRRTSTCTSDRSPTTAACTGSSRAARRSATRPVGRSGSRASHRT
jgi:PAS domain S-box-containing protein